MILKELPEAARREIIKLPNGSQSHDADGDGLPNFLEDTKPEVQAQFRAVWFDTSLDKNPKTAKLQKLADTLLTAAQKELFRKQLKDVDNAHQDALKAVDCS